MDKTQDSEGSKSQLHIFWLPPGTCWCYHIHNCIRIYSHPEGDHCYLQLFAVGHCNSFILYLWNNIHKIMENFQYRNCSKSLKSLTDNQLISVILLPVATDVLVNILWSSIDPSTFTIQLGHNLMASATCKSQNEIVWALYLVIPKLALLIIILHFATATRWVHIREFKQTKSINILTFSLLMLNGLCLSLLITLRSVISQWAISVSYISVSSLFLGLVVLCIILILLLPLIPPIKEKLLKSNSLKSTTSWTQTIIS